MKMIRSIVRPEKYTEILNELLDGGFPSVTKIDVLGRGKQRGIQVGNVHYDQLQKVMLMMVVEDRDVKDVIDIIWRNAKSGHDGAYGDGKIFVTSVEDVYTISTGENKL